MNVVGLSLNCISHVIINEGCTVWGVSWSDVNPDVVTETIALTWLSFPDYIAEPLGLGFCVDPKRCRTMLSPKTMMFSGCLTVFNLSMCPQIALSSD